MMIREKLVADNSEIPSHANRRRTAAGLPMPQNAKSSVHALRACQMGAEAWREDRIKFGMRVENRGVRFASNRCFHSGRVIELRVITITSALARAVFGSRRRPAGSKWPPPNGFVASIITISTSRAS